MERSSTLTLGSSWKVTQHCSSHQQLRWMQLAATRAVIENMWRLKADSLRDLLVTLSKNLVVKHATLRVLDRYALGPVLGKGSFLHRLVLPSEQKPVIGFLHHGWAERESLVWDALRLKVDETPLGLASINLEEPDNARLQSILSGIPLPAVIVFFAGHAVILFADIGRTDRAWAIELIGAEVTTTDAASHTPASRKRRGSLFRLRRHLHPNHLRHSIGWQD